MKMKIKVPDIISEEDFKSITGISDDEFNEEV